MSRIAYATAQGQNPAMNNQKQPPDTKSPILVFVSVCVSFTLIRQFYILYVLAKNHPMISVGLIYGKFLRKNSNLTPLVEEDGEEEPPRSSPCTEDDDYDEDDFGRLHGTLASQMYETCDK